MESGYSYPKDFQKISHSNLPMAIVATFPTLAPSSMSSSTKNTWTTNISNWTHWHSTTTPEQKCPYNSKLMGHTKQCSFQQPNRNKKQLSSIQPSTTLNFWKSVTLFTTSKTKSVNLRDLRWRDEDSSKLLRFSRVKYSSNISKAPTFMSVIRLVLRWLGIKSTYCWGRAKTCPTMIWYRIFRSPRCWVKIWRSMISRRVLLSLQPRD